MSQQLNSAARLAGFFAAHAVWCVSDGSTLIPMLGRETHDGKRQVQRFLTPPLEKGVKVGSDQLALNPEGAVRAVLVYDGFITLPPPTGKIDALLLDIRVYGSPTYSLVMAVPYRPLIEGQKFSVYRPKFLSCDFPDPNYETLGVEFFHGVDAHEKGAAVWNLHIDQSL